MCFGRISNPRIDSSESAEVTLRKRSMALVDMRTAVSGSKSGARRQLADELKHTSREERQSLLKLANITPEIPAGEGLAMKAELAIPWNKLRHLRRYMYTHS